MPSSPTAKAKSSFSSQLYGDLTWHLPGGAIDPGETIQDCVERECWEELGQKINVLCLTGAYYQTVHNSHVFIFRAELCSGPIVLSPEHSQFRYFALEEFGAVQRKRVEDCLQFKGRGRQCEVLRNRILPSSGDVTELSGRQILCLNRRLTRHQ